MNITHTSINWRALSARLAFQTILLCLILAVMYYVVPMLAYVVPAEWQTHIWNVIWVVEFLCFICLCGVCVCMLAPIPRYRRSTINADLDAKLQEACTAVDADGYDTKKTSPVTRHYRRF